MGASVGMVSTARLTQVIQKGQCGKADSKFLAAQSYTNRLTLVCAGLTALFNTWLLACIPLVRSLYMTTTPLCSPIEPHSVIHF